MPNFDELWPGGLKFIQGEGSFKLSTDSVLLADFANMRSVKRALDLGSGAGALDILLAYKNPQAELWGIEIQPESAAESRLNLAENQMDHRVKIIDGDLRQHRELVPVASFDLVVANPPYFEENSGYSASSSQRATAREEKTCSLSDLCAAVKWALRYGGSFALVHRPERLSEILCKLTAAGIEPKRLRMVCHSADRAPSLVLIEARRGARKGLRIEAPLILKDELGQHSKEILRIYHREKLEKL